MVLKEEANASMNNTNEFEGLPSINTKDNKNIFLDRKMSNSRLLAFHSNSITRRTSVLSSPQELILNRQAKKLFDIGQGGLSLPGLSYLSTKIHSPSQKRDSIRLAAQIASPKPLNETSQDALNKQFPLFQVTDVNEFENQIDFFSSNQNGGNEKEGEKRAKSQMKVNFTNKRRKDSIVVDLIQMQGKNTFIQPQFMQERGSMCITELWPESMKKELINSHQQSHKKIQHVKNIRMNNSDKSFMSVFRPEKQKQSVNIFQSVRDDNSRMVLSKFSEKNVIGVFGLMNENRTNKILTKQRSFGLNSPTSQLKSGQQTPNSYEDSVIENMPTQTTQYKAGNNNLNNKQSKSNFYNNHFIFPSGNEINQQQKQISSKNLSKPISQAHIQSSKYLTLTPKKQNQSTLSVYSQNRPIKQQQNELNSHSLFIKNTQNLLESKHKLDILKNECEEELENNLDIEKSINTNLKDMNNKLSTLLSKLS